MILFLAVTARQQTVEQKIKNFFTKWREVQQKIPLPEMTELLITPQLAEYPKIAEDVFMLLLDGKLRSRTERLNFLKPLAPPPPPPPPPPKRGRGKAAAAAAPAQTPTPTSGKGKKKGKGEPAPAAPAPLLTKAAVKSSEPAKAGKSAEKSTTPQKVDAKKPAKSSPKKPVPKPAKSAKKKH